MRSAVNASLFRRPPPIAPRPSASNARASPSGTMMSFSIWSSVTVRPAARKVRALERAGDLPDAAPRNVALGRWIG